MKVASLMPEDVQLQPLIKASNRTHEFVTHPLGSMSTMLGIISRVVSFLSARVAFICSAA